MLYTPRYTIIADSCNDLISVNKNTILLFIYVVQKVFILSYVDVQGAILVIFRLLYASYWRPVFRDERKWRVFHSEYNLGINFETAVAIFLGVKSVQIISFVSFTRKERMWPKEGVEALEMECGVGRPKQVSVTAVMRPPANYNVSHSNCSCD